MLMEMFCKSFLFSPDTSLQALKHSSRKSQTIGGAFELLPELAYAVYTGFLWI